MSNTIVRDAIRRSNRNQITWSLIGMVLVFGAGILSSNYLYNALLGPFPTDSATVAGIENINGLGQYYLTVTGDDVADTGFSQVSRNTRTGSETVKASYAALFVGDRLLLIKDAAVVGDGTVPVYTGKLVTIPSDVRSQVINQLETEVPEIKGMFLPFMLDTGDFKTTGFIGLAVGAVILLVCLWILLRAVGRQSNPSSHPIMKSLARFGDPEMIADDIESEVGALEDAKKSFSGLRFTRKWLIQAKGGGLVAMPYSDVAWLYKMVTQHRTNGIPTRKTYAAHILDRYGVRMMVAADQGRVDEVLQAVINRAPWAVGGYTKDLEAMFKSNRAGFVAGVEQRKQKLKDG